MGKRDFWGQMPAFVQALFGLGQSRVHFALTIMDL